MLREQEGRKESVRRWGTRVAVAEATAVLREGRAGNVGHQTECAENVVSHYGCPSLSGDIRTTSLLYGSVNY
jgi:hypothetical protein